MPAPYHSLHRKLENVLKAYLANQADLDATVYTFLECVALGTAVEEPFIGIRCKRSTPTTDVQLALATGSRVVSAELSIRSHALNVSDPASALQVVKTFRQVHDELVGKTLDCFFTDTLMADLNTLCAVENGLEIEQIEQFDMTDEPEERSGVTQVTIPITCHPKEWVT
jgi:hypothetical protein